MKIRTDFVTNSSSANFIVEFQLKSDRDEVVEFAAGDDDGSNPYGALFRSGWPVKELGLGSPSERDGEVVFDGTPLAQMGSLEELARCLLRLVRPTLYDVEIVASSERFFIVGDPVRYDGREDLEATIKRLGGKVTGLADATFVIYCDKQRFCERWPEGYSYDAMDEAEQQELDAAEDVIRNEIRCAAEALWDHDTHPQGPHFDLFTGGCEGIWYQDELEWAGWSLWVQLVGTSDTRYIPILSEEEFAFFDPFGPAGDGALSTMPGSVEALVGRCKKKGITRENLRIIGGRIRVTPFGDSVWEVDDYTDQWGVNVQTGELRRTGKQVTRQAGSLEGEGLIWDADTSWQDTIWWPFTGTPNRIPYEDVASGAVRRSAVRYLDLAGLDLAQTTSMAGMFRDFWDLQRLDLSGLDTSQVTDMSELFAKCRGLQSLNLGGLDTSQVTSMQQMFDAVRACENSALPDSTPRASPT